MKSSLSILFFSFLISYSSFAQTFSSSNPDYITKVTAGENALNAAKYDSCLIYYADAFKIKQTSVLSTLRGAACAFSADNQEILDIYIDKAFELNWDMAKNIYKGYDEFKYLAGSDFDEIIESNWTSSAIASGVNLELMAEMKEIGVTDQAQRGKMRDIEKQYGWDSPQMDSLWTLQNETDSLNQLRIEEVIQKYGYPGKSLVGPGQASVAFLVIQHSNQEMQEKYLPLLKQAANDGEVRWSSVALLIDRVLLGRGDKQIYGSQIHTDQETGEFFFGEIEQPYQIDSIRATVGLGPLQDYADHWEFKYDADKHVARHTEIKKKEKAKKD